jgi:mandelate racemase
MRADLRIRSLKARAVMAPMRRPLATASGSITRAPLVLVDLETHQGVTGIAYIFSPNPVALKPLVVLLQELLPLIEGRAVAPAALERHLLERTRLLGGTGLLTLAIAGIDMAAWDVLGKAANLPLVRLWGGEARPIPAYNSTGLGLMGAEKTAAEAVELLELGFSAIKLRLGYPTMEEDVAVARAVRRAVGDRVTIMSDYNQCLDAPEAIRRGHALDGEGLYWIEEPVRADDYAGNAAVTRALKTSVQIGENFWSTHDMQKALAAQACDLVMPDVSKIGGATAWLRAAAMAQAALVPVSSHLFAEVSAHLLAAAPTAHHLEYVDWANAVLQEPLVIESGHAVIPDRPGHGMAWDEAAIGKLTA